MSGKKYAAIVLSAGRGSRMDSKIAKQYMKLGGKPLIYYSLRAFQQSKVQEIILVSGREDVEYCKREIVEKYGFTKVAAVIPGGAERYHSVYCGLVKLKQFRECPDYVMIHDGARPFVEQAVIERCARAVEQDMACVAGMPVKDTIKIADENQFAADTPKRSLVWQVQTPQAFQFPLIWRAYCNLMNREESGTSIPVTDDAMVVETMLNKKVHLVEGSYRNIKVTTPEDLEIARAFLKDLKAQGGYITDVPMYFKLTANLRNWLSHMVNLSRL